MSAVGMQGRLRRTAAWDGRGARGGVLMAGSPMLPGFGSVAAADTIPRSHGPKTKRIVARQTGEKPGTILISNRARTMDLVLDRNSVARYSVTVGRDGFTWTGTARVGDKTEWPEWRPPAEMRMRDPSLPVIVPAGAIQPARRAGALSLQRRTRHPLPHPRHQRFRLDRGQHLLGLFPPDECGRDGALSRRSGWAPRSSWNSCTGTSSWRTASSAASTSPAPTGTPRCSKGRARRRPPTGSPTRPSRKPSLHRATRRPPNQPDRTWSPSASICTGI